jgi:hypothetical protein
MNGILKYYLDEFQFQRSKIPSEGIAERTVETC